MVFLGVVPPTTPRSVPPSIAIIVVATSGVKEGSCVDVAPDTLMDSLALVGSLRIHGLRLKRGFPLILGMILRLLSSKVVVWGHGAFCVLQHSAL